MEGGAHIVVVTGDSPHAAISVAIRCGLVKERFAHKVFICDTSPDNFNVPTSYVEPNTKKYKMPFYL
jgi:magnesium-transporting ATPase (P-type)